MLLDFSQITDDQLVDLIRAACSEAARRGAEAALAAEAAVLDEAEKARIARAAIERERGRFAREEAEQLAREVLAREKAQKEAEARKAQEVKIHQDWEWKETMGAKISAILRPKNAQTLQVWNKSDKRIYLGQGYNENMVVYYHTGNSRNKPRSIAIVLRPGNFSKEEWEAGKEKEVEQSLLPVFDEICGKWNKVEFEIPAYTPEPKRQEAA